MTGWVDQQYSPLLRLPTESAPSPSKEGDTRGPAELDFLPDATKVAMLLEAGADIRGAERVLREIEMLRARGVEGSGTLEGASRPLLSSI